MTMLVEFSREMELQFQRHRDTIENINKKASGLMGISVIMFAIIVGASRYVLEMASDSRILTEFPFIIFGAAWVIVIILSCISVMNTKRIREPFLGSKLSDNSQGDKIRGWITQTNDAYYERLIKEYARCLKDAEDNIKAMSVRLNFSTVIFIAGIGIMSVLAASGHAST